jgi:hypothetical protein
MTRALERAKVVRFLATRRCPSELNSKTARMGKGKAVGFHSWADGFAVCRAAPQSAARLGGCTPYSAQAAPSLQR